MKIILSLLLAVAAIPLCIAQANHGYSKLEPLGENLLGFRYGTHRTLVLVGEAGVAITDPIDSRAALQLQEAVAELTDLPITDVVYTNSFFNRVAGAGIFKRQGARIVAQQRCDKNLTITPKDNIVPVDTVYEDTYSVDVGDASLDLYYFGESYGTCLIVVIARPANIMMIYGLVNSDAASIPTDPTLANYYLHNLLAFFDRVEALAKHENIQQVYGASARIEKNTTAYSAPLGPVTLITEQKAFWQKLLGDVKVEYENRIPARALGNRLDMEAYSAYADFDEQRLKIMTRRVYSLYRIGR